MKRLWVLFGLVVFVSFLVLGWIGSRIYQEAPPIPDQVVTTDGRVIIDEGQILAGQNVWQSLGGMEVGSVWGHGSYTAPDWTADWLHREATFLLDRWAQREQGEAFDELGGEAQAARSDLREALDLAVAVAGALHDPARARVDHLGDDPRAAGP